MAAELTSGEGANKIYGAYLHTWQACVESWGIQDGKHTIMDYSTGYDFFKPTMRWPCACRTPAPSRTTAS